MHRSQLAADGAVLDHTKVDRAGPAFAIAAGPDGFLLAFRDGIVRSGSVWGLWLDSRGVAVGEPFLIDGAETRTIELAFDGESFVLASGRGDSVTATLELWVTYIAPTGAVAPPILVSPNVSEADADHQLLIRGPRTSIAWSFDLAGAKQLAMRDVARGTAPGPALELGPVQTWRIAPERDGGFALAHVEPGFVAIERFDAAGRAVAASGLDLDVAALHALVAVGDGFLVALRAQGLPAVVRVSADGEPVAPLFDYGAGSIEHVHVADDRVLVAMGRDREHDEVLDRQVTVLAADPTGRPGDEHVAVSHAAESERFTCYGCSATGSTGLATLAMIGLALARRRSPHRRSSQARSGAASADPR